MEKMKPPFTEYPGDKWLARQMEKAGSDSTITFIHGVVRGALANPSDVDAGDALEKVLGDADLEDFPQDEFDKLSIAFLLLWNDSARSLSSSCPFPQAIPSEFRTEAGALFALSDAAHLVEGFVKGFELKNQAKDQGVPETAHLLEHLKVESEWCRMMHENPDLLEKTFPGDGFPYEVVLETTGWIEECTLRVALQARKENEELSAEGLKY